MVAAYLAAAWWPFELDLPRRFDANHVNRTAGGALRFVPPTMARTAEPPPWLPAAIATGRLAVDLEVRALHSLQSGPARILSVSPDPYRTNVTFGHLGADLVIRLRRPASGRLGNPPLVITGLLGDGRWHRVRLTVAHGRLAVVADGRTRVRERLGRDPLRSWDPGYRLALGSEVTAREGWKGEIGRAVVTVRGRTYDYLRPGALVVPRSWWYVPRKPPPSPAEPADVVLNLLGFVPLGALVAWRRGGGVVVAGVAALAVSGAMEVGQLVVPGRAPSWRDLALNVVGAVAGAAVVPFVTERGFRGRIG